MTPRRAPPAPRNPVLEQSLARLGRYGYGGQDGERTPTEAELAALWQRLKGDFADLAHPEVPDLQALAPAARAEAKRYVTLKLEADRLLAECTRMHAEILAQGIVPERIEAYSRIRDDYEDMVMAFGEARATLTELLPKR